MVNGFTPTQQRILTLLSDGLPHTRAELFTCLVDELGPHSNVKQHLFQIRRKLKQHGEAIICEWVNHHPWYRHVRLLSSAYDGVT